MGASTTTNNDLEKRYPQTTNPEDPEANSPEKLPKLEVYATIVAATSFLCIGLFRAYTSPALRSMRNEVGLLNSTVISEKELVTWIASTPALAAFFGTILSGPLLQFFGRQRTIVLLSIPYIVGWILIGLANGVGMILAGRIFTGFAGGLSTPASQVYVSECCRAKVRGTLGFLPSMMLALGVLLGFAGGALNLEWRELAFVMGGFPVILLVLSFTIPESPNWLLLQNREEEALRNMVRLRKGSGISLDNVRGEMNEMNAIINLSKKMEGGRMSVVGRMKSFLNILSGKDIWLPAIISVGLMAFQQCCGANCVILYLALILEETLPKTVGSDDLHSYIDPNIGAVIVAGVQVLAFFVSLPLIDRLGRKVLLVTSAVLMFLSHAMMGTFFYLLNGEFMTRISTWLPIVCLSLLIASYSIGFGPIPFLIMSEIFPSRARSYLCSLASFVNHSTLFVTLYLFPTLITSIEPSYTFWMFGLFSLCSVIFVLIMVPETKGKTLAEIENSFSPQDSTKL